MSRFASHAMPGTTSPRALLGTAALLGLPNIVRAAGETEISFYFPVAVGGPITKIVDGYAADFQRENTAVKITPTGGGNFYLFGSASAAQRQACLRFLRWISSADRAAEWGIGSGYVATRADAWQTTAMQKYVADFPAAAVARDQLQYAVPELSTHDNQRVIQALNDSLQAALTGGKTPDVALQDAQATATRLLRPYQK